MDLPNANERASEAIKEPEIASIDFDENSETEAGKADESPGEFLDKNGATVEKKDNPDESLGKPREKPTTSLCSACLCLPNNLVANKGTLQTFRIVRQRQVRLSNESCVSLPAPGISRKCRKRKIKQETPPTAEDREPKPKESRNKEEAPPIGEV